MFSLLESQGGGHGHFSTVGLTILVHRALDRVFLKRKKTGQIVPKKTKILMRYLILTTLFACVACREKRADLSINYIDELQSLMATARAESHGQPTTVNLCKLFNKNAWDSMAIILPYLPDRELIAADLCGFSDVSDAMNKVRLDDGKTGLLFFKDGCISNYAVVSANPSFSQLLEKGRSIHFLTQSSCSIKLLSTSNDSSSEASLFFLPANFELRDSTVNDEHNKPLESLLEN